MNILSIIVTYNAEPWLSTSLGSLKASSVQTSIAVVDNASRDNTVEIIKRQYIGSIDYFFPLEENLGFGGAHNYVLSQVDLKRFDYVFLLNQDAAISSDAIKIMLSIGEMNPFYGIISPMHYCKEGVLDRWFDRHFSKAILLGSKESIGRIYEVGFINAAIWLVKAEVVKRVGGFDPIHFHYGEDVTFANRANFLGFKTIISEKVIGFHLRSQVENGMEVKSVGERLIVQDRIDLLDPGNSVLFASCKITYRTGKEIIKAFLKGEFLALIEIGSSYIASLFIIPDVLKSRTEFLNN